MKNTLATATVLLCLAIQVGIHHKAQSQDADAATSATDARSPELKERMRQRAEADRKTYSAEDLRELERLYQSANRDLRAPEAKETLKALISKYPKANRTGCAVQYLGQICEGKEKEQYLKLAIKDYSDCFYGSGVQVGAYARLYLADYYKRVGKAKDAKSLYAEIRKLYPDAVNHKGKLLKEFIPE